MRLREGQKIALTLLVVIMETCYGGLLCSTTKFGQIYEISDVFECEEEHYEVIEVRLWKRNIKQYKSAAKSLVIQEKICNTYKSFGLGKSTKRDVVTVKWYSEDRYKNHMTKGTCEDEEGREITNPPFTKDYYCEYSWLRHRTFKTLSCFYQTGTVIAQHGGFMISDLGDVANCNYQKGFCKNGGGIAFSWSPKKEEKLEWLEVGKYNASKVSEGHILIGPLGLSFNLYQMKNEDNEVTYENEAFKLEILRKRGKRSTEAKTALEMLKSEINRKLQYMADKFLTPAAQLNSLCKALELSLRLSKILVKTNPTQYMRDILNNTELIAQATSNNFVKVWPCVKVTSMTWRTVKKKCFASIPISYVFNKIEYEGFLDDQTGVIYDESVEVSCKISSPKIFNYDNKVFKYEPGHIPTLITTDRIMKLPILPQNKSDMLIDIPEEWVFNRSDLKSNHLQNSIFRNLQNRMDNLEDKSDSNDPLARAKEDRSEIRKFFGLRGINIHQIMETCILWIFRLGSVCGMLALYGMIRERKVWHRRTTGHQHTDQSSVYISVESEL